MPPFWRRHLIAGTISFIMVTGWLAILGSIGMLGAIIPADHPLERSLLGGITLTLALFFPWALMADWISGKSRRALWAPPLLLALAVSICCLAAEAIIGNYHPTFILTYTTVGIMIAAMFCGYWVPLQMLRSVGTAHRHSGN